MSTYIGACLWAKGIGGLARPVIAATLLMSLAGVAHAADPRDKEAARLFFAGRVPEALAVYGELAADTGNPIYMCEIGRCHQRLGNLVEARRNVRECLAAAKLTPAKKRQFQAVLAEIEAAEAQAPAAAAAAPPPPAAAAPPPPMAGPPAPPPPGGPPAPLGPGPGAPPPPPSGSPVASAPPPPGQPPPPGWNAGPYGQYGPPPAHLRQGADAGPPAGGGGWMRPTAYAAGAVGLLGVGAGVYSGMTAKKKFDEVVRVYDDAAYKEGKKYNTYQFIGYGVGAAGLGAALVLFLKSSGGESPTAAASGGLALVVDPQGLGVAGRF